jgi:hypothetical protein
MIKFKTIMQRIFLALEASGERRARMYMNYYKGKGLWQ